MALIRGYSRVEEDGKIAVPEHIRRWTQLTPGCLIDFRVMRVRDTSRRPHMTFIRSGRSPFISLMEVAMMEGNTVVNEEGKIVLDETILDEARLEPGHLIELKVAGSRQDHWLTVHNRVRYSPTFVPKETRVEQEVKKGWRTVDINY